MAETENLEYRWYALRAVSGKEGKVKEYIETAISNGTLAPYVSQALIPMERTYVDRNGKRAIKDKNLLPSYVLVQAALVGDIAFRLRNIPNVLGILGGLDKPSPLQDAEVNRLIGRLDGVDAESSVLDYIVGEAVKVTDGPFKGFSGVIDTVNNEKKKLTVMVKVFGRNTPLVLGFMQVARE